jgi:polysaccharide pyruvyl transferase WcaK-like protein
MKILHVASFKGNIGDIANHYGFRNWFGSFFDDTIEWQNFEIRDVYRKVTSFGDSFVDLANKVDLVVIGGGNFFELWVENSPTGTSISIQDSALDKIRTPIYFNALGVDDGMGFSDNTIAKFNRFFDRLINSSQYLVSVRNDGAFQTLSKHVVSKRYLSKVIRIPDGGFFAELGNIQNKKNLASPLVGINLAGDMLETRFPGKDMLHNYQSFLVEFALLLKQILEKWPTVKFVMFPHIYSDLRVYSDLMDVLPDAIRRNQVRIAAYDANLPALDTVFSEYINCNVVLGMRFHSNVVAIANGIPSIGLQCYKQIQSLFYEIGIEKYLVDVRKPGFSKEIQCLLDKTIEDKCEVSADLLKIKLGIESSRNSAAIVISAWLAQHGFKPNCSGLK